MIFSTCEDCNVNKATTVWGLGRERCDLCSEAFREKIRLVRVAAANLEARRRQCYQPIMDAAHEAGERCEADYCEECCEHEFDSGEGFHCLNCGKDGNEEIMSAAYDKAKDLRKYGE